MTILKPNARDVRQAAAGRWGTIIPAVTDCQPDTLVGQNGRPCPRCGGTDRFSPFNDFDRTGGVTCRHCHTGTSQPKCGNGVATVQWLLGCTHAEAVSRLSDYLGLNGQKLHNDIVAEVALDKRMPVDAFRSFGAKPAKRGQLAVVRVDAYDEHGEVFSYFDLAPGQKGWFKRGKGNAGMFFPGRAPQPGETWMLVEGVKDAAALIEMGYLAAGMPTCRLPSRFARLFAGCHVILVHDLDTAGRDGAQATGGRLAGIAESVRVARLPGEIRASDGDDVRDILAKPHGRSLVKEAIDTAVAWTPRADKANREINLSLDEATVADQVVGLLALLGWEDGDPRHRVYQRLGQLVHVTRIADPPKRGFDVPKQMLRIRPLPPALLRERIASAAQLRKQNGDGEWEPTRPPGWLVNAIDQRGEYPAHIRPLVGIVFSPTLRPDGSLLQVPGYDVPTGLLYLPDGDFPLVSEEPTQEAARRAAAEVLDVVCDFPFEGDAHRSGWLAYELTLVGRPAIPGPCPLFAFDANTRGSGKSMLCDAASTIAYGDRMARKTWPTNDDEVRKAITAVAREAIPAVLLDNVASTLGSPSLDAALSGTTWTDRILGKNETTGTLPLTTVWSATGNNMVFGSDTARRTLYCRLESLYEHPEDRRDFRRPQLLSWTASQRHRLATAAVTVLRAYIVAGRPDQGLVPWGSFEAWSDLIRAAIVWVGLPDPVQTRISVRNADRSAELLRLLLDGIVEADSGDGVTTAEIVRLLAHSVGADDPDSYPTLRAAAEEICGPKPDARKLGYRLRSYVGRVCGHRRLGKKDGGHGNVTRWSVESLISPPSNDNPPKSSPPSPTSPPSYGGDGGHGGDGGDDLAAASTH